MEASLHRTYIYITLVGIVLGSLAFSCSGPGTATRARIPALPESRRELDIILLEKEIHSLINTERIKKGLALLSWNDDLSRAARKHSRDMAERSYFSHVSPDGNDFSDRYRREGYSCSIAVRETIYSGAENLYQNNLYDRVVFMNGRAHYDWNTMQEMAESTVQGWMNSPGHRKNILTPHWKSEGIGAAVSGDGKVYITQNFC